MIKNSMCVLVTCEHGGNQVPTGYEKYFDGQEEILNSHRGYDPGALSLARVLADRLCAHLVYSEITRLLVDLNRSSSSRSLFSDYTRELGRDGRQLLMAKFYQPYRERVAGFAGQVMAEGSRLVHLSVHSFTPVFNGNHRDSDVGLLYDPGRFSEKAFCRRWKHRLNHLLPILKVRYNWPYRGTADGLVRSLRSRYRSDDYLGIELEVNQGLLDASGHFPSELVSALVETLAYLVGDLSREGHS